MSRCFGVVSRYFNHELTYAAIQFAERLQQEGQRVSFGVEISKARNISSYWDTRVKWLHSSTYVNWLNTLSGVLWVGVPSYECVAFAATLGVPFYIMPPIDELCEEDQPALEAANAVLLPYKMHAKLVTAAYPEIKAVYMPWMPDTPPIRAGKHATKQAVVHFPLYDSQTARSTCSTFGVIQGILDRVPWARISIAISGRWCRRARNILEGLCDVYGDRRIVVNKPDPYRRLDLFRQADLTVWTSCYEDLATVGLQSLSVGTPVIAWDISPQNEYLKHKGNSFLVPCELKQDWIGAPEADDQTDAFENATVGLLQNRLLLAQLTANAVSSLDIRRRCFNEGWRSFRAV